MLKGVSLRQTERHPFSFYLWFSANIRPSWDKISCGSIPYSPSAAAHGRQRHRADTPRRRSFVCRQAAGQQGRRHTGQYISAAAPGKAWVSGRVCAHAAIRCSHHGTAALEYHHSVPFFCILAGSIFTVRIDLRHRKPGEPGHLAGVAGSRISSPAGSRQRFALGQQLRGGVQAVRIQHRAACKAGQQLLHQRACFGRAACALGCTAKARPSSSTVAFWRWSCGMLSGEMPPSAPTTQGHRQHSGRRATAAANTGSTLPALQCPHRCAAHPRQPAGPHLGNMRCLPQPIRCQSCPCGCRAGAAGCCARQIRM